MHHPAHLTESLTLKLPLRVHGIGEEVLVSEPEAVLEPGLAGPAEGGGLGNAQELARSTVRAGGVPPDGVLAGDLRFVEAADQGRKHGLRASFIGM